MTCFYFTQDGSDEHLCPYTFTFEECIGQTGEELCLWQNEAPEQLVWKVIASKLHKVIENSQWSIAQW